MLAPVGSRFGKLTVWHPAPSQPGKGFFFARGTHHRSEPASSGDPAVFGDTLRESTGFHVTRHRHTRGIGCGDDGQSHGRSAVFASNALSRHHARVRADGRRCEPVRAHGTPRTFSLRHHARSADLRRACRLHSTFLDSHALDDPCWSREVRLPSVRHNGSSNPFDAVRLNDSSPDLGRSTGDPECPGSARKPSPCSVSESGWPP